MNALLIRVALVLALVSENACAQEVVVGNRSYALSTAEEAKLTELALAGSGEAATQISDRYYFDPTIEENPELKKKALEWALIGSENGAADAQFRAFQLLSTSTDRGNQVRALFWLKNAATKGNRFAGPILKECPSVDSQHNHGRPCFGPDR